ncbi:MAG TPA: UDP-N-acetylmuramate dehydrogenase [Nocardioidaceae bacterium]|nr:UDP-N-acetylmuramate dehydrogenase [Nocardioidaceae bacterium]
MTDLRELTTLRLGGPADQFFRVTTEQELLDVECGEDDLGDWVLLIAGGSNLVVADEGFRGAAIKIDTRGIEVEREVCAGACVTVAAGESWDDFVALAVDSGWTGIEALAGIPGSVGATPIQNVGAYGQEVSEVVARVRCWDRGDLAIKTFSAAECGFGYRTSRFKAEPQRYVVLNVMFQFKEGTLSAPIRYTELARTLGVELGARVPMGDVRAAVLDLRRAKGMVLDATDHDTWSAGSFFTNPFVAAAPEGAPAYPQPDGTVKTSAAWLIEQAGFGKGYGNDRVGLSTKHTLALTNRGSGTTRDLLALAEEIQRGVHASYGIWLVNEPVLVGCTLPDPPLA